MKNVLLMLIATMMNYAPPDLAPKIVSALILKSVMLKKEFVSYLMEL